jgi:hypothetical protein
LSFVVPGSCIGTQSLSPNAAWHTLRDSPLRIDDGARPKATFFSGKTVKNAEVLYRSTRSPDSSRAILGKIQAPLWRELIVADVIPILQAMVVSLSTLFRNVPIVNLLEMSPFAVDVEQNIAVALYEQG